MPRKSIKKGGNNEYIIELIKKIRLREDIRNIEDLINNMVQRGINLDTRDKSGNTPLMVAANSGNKDIIKLLLDNGANVNLKDGMNRSVLMTAINSSELSYLEEFENEKNRRFEIVKFLLDNNADVNVKDGLYEVTPLIRLSQMNDINTLKLLIDRGANVNDKETEFDRTALFYAIQYNKVENVKILLDNGADIYIKDKIGNTPLEYANLLSVDKKIINLINGVKAVKKLTAIKHSTKVPNYGLYDAMTEYYREHPDEMYEGGKKKRVYKKKGGEEMPEMEGGKKKRVYKKKGGEDIPEMEGGKKKRVYKKKEEDNIFKKISFSFKKLLKF